MEYFQFGPFYQLDSSLRKLNNCLYVCVRASVCGWGKWVGFVGVFYQQWGDPALTGGGLYWGAGDRHYGGCGVVLMVLAASRCL